ncbi:mechanosensitive ion channel [Neolewinella lacunae]|uniref:Mechanosensitive ion channel n=1 Tax=Neolewinella lacunae TaxID=1517758 RepID=A0A923T8Q3_9BACT|nr:mechanosensitive ion channel domain-containing protein [Neolewinella lacunae]MBC6994809.1 mechanosensitive ion channel [Neolewinella lacunae]MDN3634431.1 mechanosensitive ion channel [Neolewinella lacunae]
MEKLREIEFYLGTYPITLYQVVLIVLVLASIALAARLVLGTLLPKYYGRENISARNQSRTKRVIRLVFISLLLVAILRILDIDYTFFAGSIQDAPTDDGAPVWLTIRISTIVKILVAFIVANVLDLVAEEVLVQRFYTRSLGKQAPGAEQKELTNRFNILRPLMYTAALSFIANDTGLSRYYLYLVKNGEELTWSLTVGRVLLIGILFFLLKFLLRVTTTFVLSSYYRRSNIDTGSQFAIDRLLTYFVYVIGTLIVIQAAGFNLLVVWTGAAALLVGIGIGLQQTFNDLICGIIILFERSVKVGDVVELSGHQVGAVRKIGARTSIVETRDDIIIFVPNSKLIGENVTNWSQVERKARFRVGVGVAYGSDLEVVKEILLAVANEHSSVLKMPSPFVRFADFGSSSLDFEIIFWSRDFLRIEVVKSDLRFAIDKAFREKGVEIPFPQQDVWIRGNQTSPDL